MSVLKSPRRTQMSDPGEREANGHGLDVEHAVHTAVESAMLQLTQLWVSFGLSGKEQQQQHRVVVAAVEKACQTRVQAWRDEVDKATKRIGELEEEVQKIKAQFQGSEAAGWCIESLSELHGTHGRTLRDRLAALEMEFKFLDSVRSSRMAEINRLRDQLSKLDHKLGTTTLLPPDEGTVDLSEEHKVMLRNLVHTKSREVHTRRAALLEAVRDCARLAQELQIEAEHVFDADVDARLKKRDLSLEMLRKISERTVELREQKTKREARLAEMLGQIHVLWNELEVPEQERERFRKTVHGIGEAAIASCKAELARLQRHHKRFSAIVVQVTSLRDTITKHWDLLGYSSEARGYFADMMNTADSELSYKIFRAHEKEAERLRRQLFTMRVLTSYVVKREEIAHARAENSVPDDKLRVRIDRDLPRYTAILNERIDKWQKETGVVFRWNGEPYLERMRREESEHEQESSQSTQQELSAPAPTRESRGPSQLGYRRRIQTRHSTEERTPPRSPSMETQMRLRRSDPQAPHQHTWRNFLASTFSRRHRPSS